LIVPAVPVLFKAPAEDKFHPLIVCVVAVVKVSAAVDNFSPLVVPAPADEPVIAPPAIVIPLVVPPFVAVKVPTERSRPFVVAVPVVLVSNVPVEIFTPSLSNVLAAKFKVEAGVTKLAPVQFNVPAAPPVAIAPAVPKFKPLTFKVAVVDSVNAAVVKLIPLIVPV